MADRPPPTLADSIAAAQAWWREAGVDLTFHDDPAAWLAEEAPHASEPEPAAKAVPKPAPPPEPPPGGDPASWPTDLSAIQQWWLKEPTLDAGGTHPRIPPRGPAHAPVMFLVPMPEAEDRDTLLSGAQGRLLASLATAMGLAPEQVYLAAALPRHSALPDWDRLAAQGYGALLLHHIALAAPQRLIAFGSNVWPLIGHDPAQGAPAVSEIAIQGRTVPLLASYAPARLLEHARLRKGLWQRWLEWTDGDAQ